MTHTPGPWTVNSAGNAPGHYDIKHVSDDWQPGIADVWASKVGPGRSLDEAEANARLIAAAPDMKELLLEWIAWYPHEVCEEPRCKPCELVVRTRRLFRTIDEEGTQP